MRGAAGTEQAVGRRDDESRRSRVRLLLAATFLRLYHLDESSLWLDEITTEWYSQEAPQELLENLVERDDHPPLTYLIAIYRRRLAGGLISLPGSRGPLWVSWPWPSLWHSGRDCWGGTEDYRRGLAFAETGIT